MVHVEYFTIDESANTILLILSSKDNEDFLSQYLTEREQKNYVLMENIITGYRISPEFDEQKDIVGSRVDYCTSVRDGGNLPQWVIDTMMP